MYCWCRARPAGSSARCISGPRCPQIGIPGRIFLRDRRRFRLSPSTKSMLSPHLQTSGAFVQQQPSLLCLPCPLLYILLALMSLSLTLHLSIAFSLPVSLPLSVCVGFSLSSCFPRVSLCLSTGPSLLHLLLLVLSPGVSTATRRGTFSLAVSLVHRCSVSARGVCLMGSTRRTGNGCKG